jgi:hypothetical protein
LDLDEILFGEEGEEKWFPTLTYLCGI